MSDLRSPTPTRGAGPSRALALSLAALAGLVAAAAQAQAPASGQAAPAAAASGAAPEAPSAGARGPAPASMEVRGFVLQGVTLLDPAQLEAGLAAWQGRRSLAELQQAAASVQAAYARASYGGVAVWLPPQDLAGGRVRIQVLEGRLARVQVKGGQRWTAERVRQALPSLQPGLTPRLRLLDAELQLANDLPARQLGVLLAPGTGAGEVDATVSVQERRRWQGQATLDNTGNRATGWWRLGAGVQASDLAGLDDLLSLQAQTSPTQAHRVRVASLGYRVPLPTWRLGLEGYAAWSSVDGGAQATALGDVRLAGRGRIVGARLGQVLPRLGPLDQRLHLGLEQRDYLNQCSHDLLGSAVCGPAGASVRVHPLTLEYAGQSGDARALSVHVAVVGNLGLGGPQADAAAFEALRAGARVRYRLLRAGASGRWAFGEPQDAALAARLTLQLAPGPLVPGEQFGLGGATSVRGYLEREVTADRGVQASLEWWSPRLLAETLGSADLRGGVFVDGGVAWQSDGSACQGTVTRCRLVSAGLGARLDQGSAALRLAAARALRDGPATEQGDWRGHLSLQLAF